MCYFCVGNHFVRVGVIFSRWSITSFRRKFQLNRYMKFDNHILHFTFTSIYILSILFLARSFTPGLLSLSLFLSGFLFHNCACMFVRMRVYVCVCVWAILEHSAQHVPSSLALRLGGTCQLESNTSPSNTQLMDCWVRELKNKPRWLRQEHPFTHHLSISTSFSLPMNQ